jgi:transcriptional regulator with XRE-family HTH domain
MEQDTSSRPDAAAAPSSRDAFGAHLRYWRTRRRMSQMDLAGAAEMSTRHLSYVETGKSTPSRELVLRLAERLDVPLRERNALLVAAGYAPMFQQRGLQDRSMAAARRAIDLVLKGHEPYPALAVDRHWHMVSANAIVPLMLTGVSPALLQPPVNVLRLTLHPDGLAPLVVNLRAWRDHLLMRLQQQIAVTGDEVLIRLHQELAAYPVGCDEEAGQHDHTDDFGGLAVTLQMRSPAGLLSFISTITVFGSPTDVTLQELAIESFFPADDFTAEALRSMVASVQG